MSAAKIAASYINAWCKLTWPDDARGGETMASTAANGEMVDAFDHLGGGTHKYIPADRLTLDLGEPEGAGVYGYWKMYDDSYLLRTCRGPLAYWDGGDAKAAWGEFSGLETNDEA